MDQAKELLNRLNNKDYTAIDESIEFLYKYQIEHGTDFGIITADELDEMVENYAGDGFARIACFLGKVEGINDDYYYINGYGNAENIDKATIECYLSDIANGYYE